MLVVTSDNRCRRNTMFYSIDKSIYAIEIWFIIQRVSHFSSVYFGIWIEILSSYKNRYVVSRFYIMYTPYFNIIRWSLLCIWNFVLVFKKRF